TWSHAALYLGDMSRLPPADGSSAPDTSRSAVDTRPMLIEADLQNGVHAVPLSKYDGFNTRICRPVGLVEDDLQQVLTFMMDSIGLQYDLKNIVDLARYLIPTPPVPVRWRRRMLALGSGDPTRVICSTRIAQAFHSVRYPILPRVEKRTTYTGGPHGYLEDEVLHIRHYSLFTPRDFDLSPYFSVVKPTLERGFRYREINWGDWENPG
ncbi:MAG: lipo-like protein, partial [Proteobacteria bacterium]|nr:lipo-like protein [Pseudomonadota bacterium]